MFEGVGHQTRWTRKRAISHDKKHQDEVVHMKLARVVHTVNWPKFSKTTSTPLFVLYSKFKSRDKIGTHILV